MVLGVLLALGSQTVQENEEKCHQCVEACERSAKRASLTLRVFYGMLHPDALPDIIADLQGEADDGSIAAFLALRDLEPYHLAIMAEFDDHAHIWKERPFAVFADGLGGGLVLYPAGWGFRIGSRMGNGFITRITDESLTITDPKTNDEHVVVFEGVYLAGRVVDEKGIGMEMADVPTMDDYIRGWKGKH